jgi:hypothetical protein
MLDTSHTFFFRFLFLISPFKSNYLRHIHFSSLSTYAITVPFLSTINPSIHPSNDTKRLDVDVGMHYTITDSTIASKYIYTETERKNKIAYETLVFFLTRQVRFCLCETKYYIRREGDRTPISHLIMKRKKRRKKKR